MKRVHIYSFGCAHVDRRPPPSPLNRPWDLCVNVQHLKDPHASGLDPQVRNLFLELNSGEAELITTFADFMVGLAFKRFDEAALAISCKHGFARSVSMTEVLGEHFRRKGYEVEIVHLHHNEPMIKSDCDD